MSEYTKNTYERSLATIRKGLGGEKVGSMPLSTFGECGLNFLSGADRVIQWIDNSKYATNSKKVFYIAIVSTLKAGNLFPEAIAQYKKRLDELNRKVADDSEDQALTASEQAKYVEWPVILDCLENKIFPAVSDLATFQEYLIISLYCLMPPLRLDYAEMKVVTAEPPSQAIEGNYLVMSKKPYILLTQYKTARRYGAQRIVLPKKLVEIVKEWRTMQDTDYLLVSPASNNPMPPWELGQTIIKVFEKHLGKSIGVNILRHSYISWMRKDDLAPKKSNMLAKAMLHSIGMSQMYRRTD